MAHFFCKVALTVLYQVYTRQKTISALAKSIQALLQIMEYLATCPHLYTHAKWDGVGGKALSNIQHHLLLLSKIHKGYILGSIYYELNLLFESLLL